MSDMDSTYDGQPIAKEKPFGACVVVYRESAEGPEFLIMHRGHDGPDYEGDWAWTPPAGARFPGEDIHACAQRELKEETGLDLPIALASAPDEAWAAFVAKAPPDAAIVLNEEHDRFEWLSADAALARCQPQIVRAEIEAAIAAISA
jgi:8-oxo-dGTP pyrophosphatase MutT (NUDIX family)